MNALTAINRAHDAWKRGDLDAMQKILRRGLAVAPRHDVLRSFWAECQLLRGNWAPEVWRTWNRVRFLSVPPAVQADYMDLRDKWPEWDGSQALTGAIILVWHDGGAGDAVQFYRYRPLLEAAGAEVVWHTPERNRGLLPHEWDDGGLSVSAFVPLQSLPGCFGTTPDTIPAPVNPWGYVADPIWPPRRVATCWRGNPQHGNDWARSIHAGELDLSDLSFELVKLPEKGSWAETVQLLAGIDLLVTVDTAVAHIAATLGVHVWLLVATVQDWRWLTKRDDTPWYPTVRIFRQRIAGEWAGALHAVRRELEMIA